MYKAKQNYNTLLPFVYFIHFELRTFDTLKVYL